MFGTPETIDVMQKYQPTNFAHVVEDYCFEIEQEDISFDGKEKRSLERKRHDKKGQNMEGNQVFHQFQSKSQNQDILQDQEKSTAIDTERNKYESHNRSTSAAENIKEALKYAPHSVPNRSNQLLTNLRNKSSTPFMFGAKKEKYTILAERSLNQNNQANDKIQSSSKISTDIIDIDIQFENERQRTQSQYFVGNHHSISSEQMVLDVFS